MNLSRLFFWAYIEVKHLRGLILYCAVEDVEDVTVTSWQFLVTMAWATAQGWLGKTLAQKLRNCLAMR